MLDLSDILPRKMPEWYELHLHQLAEMKDYQRDAHIRSMKQSQMHDYGAKLRVVLGPQDAREVEGLTAWNASVYKNAPGFEVAMREADEVVVRRPDDVLHRTREMVLKGHRSGDVRTEPIFRQIEKVDSAPAAGADAGKVPGMKPVTSAVNATRAKLDL